MEKAGEVVSRAGPHKSSTPPRVHTQRRVRGAHDLRSLVVVEIDEARTMRKRRHHRVTGVVRKLVQHHDRAWRSPYDQVSVLIVRMLDDPLEKTPGFLHAADVLHAPRRPQPLH